MNCCKTRGDGGVLDGGLLDGLANPPEACGSTQELQSPLSQLFSGQGRLILRRKVLC